MHRKLGFILLPLGVGLILLQVPAKDLSSIEPGPDTRCPVCGMFVAKYPNWIAQVEFLDGSAAFFDGAKDMFRFLLDIGKYRPDADSSQTAGIFITDYYRSKRIDARTAFYVIGSDVFGPMGKELVPFDSEEAAADFKSDHAGEQILRFSEIDRDCIERLK